MKQRAWPSKSDGAFFTALSFIKKQHNSHQHHKHQKNEPRTSRNHKTVPKQILYSQCSPNHHNGRGGGGGGGGGGGDLSGLPYDVLSRIAASFTLPDLQSASLVCRAWRDALQPLREAMLFLRWGKKFKHGRGGVKPNLEKALDSFLKGAARGSTLAMVDAGLVYWEMDRRDEAVALYERAAQLGDPTAQCNLGISFLQAVPPKPKEAVKWLHQASVAGHVRAQYQLALCLHQGRGLDQNIQEAARWYLRAAEGGYTRAMYNASLCFSFGEGFGQSHRLARKWMKRAADRGHSKAQFEHGLSLFSEGDMMKAVVYLELATRAGEAAAGHVKNVVLQQLSATSRDCAMHLADTWRALPSSR